MKILIVIPAFNEAENIQNVVDRIHNQYSQYDYIVVNDGSTDNTINICHNQGYEVLDLPVNLGLAGAFQTGMRYAWFNKYDVAVQLDGDGQHNPFFIEKMLDQMLKSKADIVIGSRFAGKKKPRSMRMLGSNMISLAIWITTGKRIADPTSGMRLYNRAMLREFSLNLNYGPEPDTISYLISKGAKVSEVQVEMKERIAGESYLSSTRALRYMAHMCASIIFIQHFRKRSV